MNLAASLIVHNERHRYLEPCIEHLLEFCDQVCLIDDGSTDSTHGWASAIDRVHCARTEHRFFEHEGNARQFLIEWTLAREPTHVLSLDADEFVDDGAALRARIEAEPEHPTWALDIAEVWNVNEDEMKVREDGGWRTHRLIALWKAPARGERYTMLNRKLACRRVPEQVLKLGARAKPTGATLLHYGWTNPAERHARYERYAKHDGGRYHAGSHLRSILWPDARMKFSTRSWPEGAAFDAVRARLVGALGSPSSRLPRR